MRILIYGINFSPELTGVGKYTGEMAEWLSSQGHELRVVSAPPYYPAWRVGDRYASYKYKLEKWPLGPGIEARIWRCPLWIPKKVGGISRIVHLFSFALSSFPVVLAQAVWRPDVVLIIEPTLTCAPVGLLCAWLCHARPWLHIQDFEVDAAFGMGILRFGKLRNAAYALERFIMNRFDRVSTISERMLDRLADKDVPEQKQYLFPNWADTKTIYPLQRASTFREKLGIDNETIVALYAGNLGEKQGLGILVQATQYTQDQEHILWVIAGAGSAKKRLQDLSSDLPNMCWLNLQPIEQLNDLLNLADIHVLPQRADAADVVMPSKLTGMLASGRPVVATAWPETQVGKVVSQCGVLVEPGDGQKMAKAVTELAADPEKRQRLGTLAREYAEDNLNFHSIMNRFEYEAVSLVHDTK